MRFKGLERKHLSVHQLLVFLNSESFKNKLDSFSLSLNQAKYLYLEL